MQEIGKEIIPERQGEVFEKNITEGTSENYRMFYLESYGCQMNFSDSEIVASILFESGWRTTKNAAEADLIFINTCAIRDNAEQRVRGRLKEFKGFKKKKPDLLVGVLGCMAERLKSKFLEEEKLIDLVVGPDSYRELPMLIDVADSGQKAVNVLLSREETYADINPVRLNSNGISAFISIMRGCDNMCSFCVVPFTRGRERSRNPLSIYNEIRDLSEKGFKEVTLLGQNVDSYKWVPSENMEENTGPDSMPADFAKLLEEASKIDPGMRIRFSTSHPKDITDKVLEVMARYENICKYIHLPVQSGNSRILELMNRTYDRSWYMDRIDAIRRIVPDCGISTDIITGFCTETEEEHQETLSMMSWVNYDFAYMFKYSERPGTMAARQLQDDVPEAVKSRRLNEIIELQQKLSIISNQKDIGKVCKVLVENVSKKSGEYLSGRNSQNKIVVFPKENFKPGDYVDVLIESCTVTTLIGKVVTV